MVWHKTKRTSIRTIELLNYTWRYSTVLLWNVGGWPFSPLIKPLLTETLQNRWDEIPTFGKCNNAYVQPFPPPNLSKILQLYEKDKLLWFTIIYTQALKNIENYQGSYLFFNFFPSSFEAGRIIALYGPSTYKEFSPQLLTSYSSFSFVKTAGKNWTVNGDHLLSINNAHHTLTRKKLSV